MWCWVELYGTKDGNFLLNSIHSIFPPSFHTSSSQYCVNNCLWCESAYSLRNCSTNPSDFYFLSIPNINLIIIFHLLYYYTELNRIWRILHNHLKLALIWLYQSVLMNISVVLTFFFFFCFIPWRNIDICILYRDIIKC